MEEIETAMTVFAHGLNNLYRDQFETEESKMEMTRSDVSCYNNSPESWHGGKKLR